MTGMERCSSMNPQLLLRNIRDVLIRLEETIIFALIERTQFKINARIYKPDAFGNATQGESLVGFLLHETECTHALVRRYTSPDEKPFHEDLPSPILPALQYEESPLHHNTVNIAPRIRKTYEEQFVPMLCDEGDDAQYGSSAVCDVACLQALARRIHYGMFVAESKFLAEPELYTRLAAGRDADAVMELITDRSVEERLLARVRSKAKRYSEEVTRSSSKDHQFPDFVVTIYRDWIIPLTKDVEIAYLFQREVS